MLETVGRHNQLMDLCRAPAGHLSAAMEQNFHQSDHPGVMDLDPWDFAFARHDGRGQALEESEVDMHVEGLSLESSEKRSVTSLSTWRTAGRLSRDFFR